MRPTTWWTFALAVATSWASGSESEVLGAPSLVQSMQQRFRYIERTNGAFSFIGGNPLDLVPAQLDLLGAAGNLTAECLLDLSLVAVALNNASLVEPGFALAVNQMRDSMASIPPGVNRAPQRFFGFRQECDLVHFQLPHENRIFTTTYSRMFVNLMGLMDPTATCENSVATLLGIDVCMPSSCNKDDLLFVFQNVPLNDTLGMPLPPGAQSLVCLMSTFEETNYDFNWRSWIVLIIVVAFTLLGALATVLDYYVLPAKSSLRKLPSVRVFLAFSFYTNVLEILTVSEARPGQINPIHCMRAVSLYWVIVCHAVAYYSLYNNDLLDFLSVADYPMTQILMNGFFSVDTFFFIGSVLVAFLWFKQLERNRKATLSGYGWLMFYLHRIIRIVPPYFISMYFYTYVMLPWFNNKQTTLTSTPHVKDPCIDYSWYNVLFFNNVAGHGDMCFSHTWYLAADMQMYVLSPIVLIPMAVNWMFGLFVVALLFALSTAGNIVTMYENRYPPAYHVTGPLDPNIKNDDIYINIMYQAPWIRCQIYLIGLVVGWFLQRCKKLRIPKAVNLAGWALTAALMLTVLFGLYRFNQGHQLPIFWRAMYSAFSRPAWGLGLGWILVSCYYGYGGSIDRFMSWSIWIPSSRLSYCMYLVHMPFIQYMYALDDNALYYPGVWKVLLHYFLPVAIVSFFVALYVSSLFEVSTGKIESFLLRRAPKKEKTEDNDSAWDTQPASTNIDLEKFSKKAFD